MEWLVAKGVKVLITRLLGRVPNNEQVFNKVCPPKTAFILPIGKAIHHGVLVIISVKSLLLISLLAILHKQ